MEDPEQTAQYWTSTKLEDRQHSSPRLTSVVLAKEKTNREN